MRKEELSVLLDKLNQTAELFYQEDLKTAYNKLIGIIPSIEDFISKIDENHQEEIKEKLTVVLSALEEMDATLLADTIKYELVEYLQGIESDL